MGSFTWKMSGRLWRQMVLLWPQTATRGEAQLHNFSKTAQPSPLTWFHSLLLCLTADHGGIATDADAETPHANQSGKWSPLFIKPGSVRLQQPKSHLPPSDCAYAVRGAECCPWGDELRSSPEPLWFPYGLVQKCLIYRFLRTGDWGLCISLLLLIAVNLWSCLFAVR